MYSIVLVDISREIKLYSDDDAEEEQVGVEMKLNSGDDKEEEDDDSEPAVGLRGYKHCSIFDTNYFGYTKPYNKDTHHHIFPMPGQAGADMLRAYLHDNLHPQLVTNEFGEQRDIMDISNDHLAILQAKLWSGRPATPSPATTPACPSRAEKLVLDHVLKIVDLLKEKYIFIVSDSANGACGCANDMIAPTLCPKLFAMVRLEPLVAWGTVGTTLEPYPILCFRRDGELMQRPEYQALVDQLVESETPTYCVDCLLHLWAKRDEAKQTLGQFRDSLRARGQAARARLQIEPQTEHSGFALINLPVLSWDGASDAAATPESSKPQPLDSGAPGAAEPEWKSIQPGPIERTWSHTLQPRKLLDAEKEIPEDPLLLKPRIAVLLTELNREKDKPDKELAALGYKIFMQTHKTICDRICICYEPANCYATRQEPSKVAQCTKADCLFTWYHYDCLRLEDQAEAREGFLVCKTCREVEEEGGL